MTYNFFLYFIDLQYLMIILDDVIIFKIQV